MSGTIAKGLFQESAEWYAANICYGTFFGSGLLQSQESAECCKYMLWSIIWFWFAAILVQVGCNLVQHLNMFILTGKLPLAFLFIFLYFVNTITLAQPNFLAFDCFNYVGNYTRNSSYQSSLDTTLSRLLSMVGGKAVYTVALCRGDVNLDVCRSCLNDSIVRLRKICPIQKQAIGYYDFCTLNYYEALLGNTINYYVVLMNTQNASDVDRFNEALSPLLNNLTAEASAGGSLLDQVLQAFMPLSSVLRI
ncbi:cysteine-rich RLK (RECEPTOR-like protein kinase) 26 [Artemisia annua]|uniref:Cysteine-rich RLK (RECEPTOR-like protein kinase) 26 n=1 Tax=Artemisia annua TaxID=35608 RepID=A0A2U1P2D8_ARTAN|nr:cysteine-rich RLK (RECEPTOR-like protein kinase) 26 [Artemisia annua]